MLTVKEIRALPPGKAVTDGGAHGSGALWIKRTQAGALVAYFRYSVARKVHDMNLGPFDEAGKTGLSLAQARARAGELQRLMQSGIPDPRAHLEEQERLAREAQAAAQAAQAAREAREALTVRAAWDRYVTERAPRWSALHLRDHRSMAQAGGEDRQRRPEVKTAPGPLAPLMPLRLVELTPAVVERLASQEATIRPTRLRLALRLLKAFLRWCGEDPVLKELVNPEAASTKKVREQAGKSGAKRDHLEKGQLAAWFQAVRAIPNPTIAAYLQILLLTGARREELALLKWEDISFQWEALHLHDKVEEAGRTIPMTRYVASLLRELQARNATPPTLPRRLRDTPEEDRPEWKPSIWVFSSRTAADGRLVEPSIAHRRACQVAGLEVTLHGLRRSFGTLSEWLELPSGVVYQIMGHKPSATAEKHYRVRPLDLLKVHHQKLEDWILSEAGISVPEGKSHQIPLRVVA